jgi:hypothetical protein
MGVAGYLIDNMGRECVFLYPLCVDVNEQFPFSHTAWFNPSQPGSLTLLLYCDQPGVLSGIIQVVALKLQLVGTGRHALTQQH